MSLLPSHTVFRVSSGPCAGHKYSWLEKQGDGPVLRKKPQRAPGFPILLPLKAVSEPRKNYTF